MPNMIAVVPSEFKVDTGELSPSLKVKRRVVDRNYRSMIDALYAEAGEPQGNTWEYTEPMQVGTSTTIRAVAVDPATGTAGEIRSFPFKIHNLQEVGPTSEEHGFPEWLRDNGWEGQEPVQLDLCLEDPLCPVVEERPNPLAPTSFPDNFPGEAFWFASESVLDVDGAVVDVDDGGRVTKLPSTK